MPAFRRQMPRKERPVRLICHLRLTKDEIEQLEAALRSLVAAAPSRERPFLLALHFAAGETRWVDPASGPGCALELR